MPEYARQGNPGQVRYQMPAQPPHRGRRQRHQETCVSESKAKGKPESNAEVAKRRIESLKEQRFEIDAQFHEQELSATVRLPPRQEPARSSKASPRRDKEKAKEESDADSMSEETLVRKLRQVNREIRRQVKERQEGDRPKQTKQEDEVKTEVKEEKVKKEKKKTCKKRAQEGKGQEKEASGRRGRL